MWGEGGGGRNIYMLISTEDSDMPTDWLSGLVSRGSSIRSSQLGLTCTYRAS